MQFLLDLKDQAFSYYDDFIVILPKLVVALITFFVLIFIAKRIKRNAVVALERRNGDPLLSSFLGRLIMAILSIFSFLICLKIIGLGGVAAGILGTASIGAFVIGFAFKDIGENFLAGFTLAFDRPFDVGDLVELGGEKGKVIALNLRTTQLKTFDGRDLFIPNAKIIKNTLVNYTVDGFMRHEFVVGLDRNDDIKQALKIIVEEMMTVDGILKQDKLPSVVLSEVNPSRVSAKVFYWLNTLDPNIDGIVVRNTVIEAVLNRLAKDEFYLPSDVVEIKNYQQKSIATDGGSEAA